MSSCNRAWQPSPQSKSQFSDPVIVGICAPIALASCNKYRAHSHLPPLRKAGRMAPVPKNVRISSLLAMRVPLFSVRGKGIELRSKRNDSWLLRWSCQKHSVCASPRFKCSKHSLCNAHVGMERNDENRREMRCSIEMHPQ